MVHDWMLDVIKDLRDFAGRNGLAISERQLDQALVEVAGELASAQGIAQGTALVGHAGKFSGSFVASRES